MTSLIFLIFCLIFKLIVYDYNKPAVSEVDQIINTITKKKLVKYISNGVELKTTLKRHYFDILDMENGKVYDREMISEQVFKHHSFYNEDIKVGYKTRCNTKDIHLAEDYVLDNYDYVIHLN
jgi:hypothetical protein